MEFGCSVGFMIVFFFVRIVAYIGGFASMFAAWRGGVFDLILKFVINILFVFVVCGVGLNYYWFLIMVCKVLRGSSKSKKDE